MAQSTVRDFADRTGVPLDRLLIQLREAGIPQDDPDAALSDADKSTLLEHIRKTHGRRDDSEDGGPSQITLKRRSHSQLKMPAGGGERRAPRGSRGAGAGRTVNVEVRKKRTYVKRSVVEAEAAEQDAQVLERALQKDVNAAEEARQAEARVRAEAEAKAEAERQEREAAEAAAAAARETEADTGAAEKAAAESSAEAQTPADLEADSQKTESEAARNKEIEDDKERKRLEAEAKREREAEERAARKASRGKGKARKKAEAGGRRSRRGGAAGAASSALQQGFEKPTAPVVRDVQVPETITVGDLAQRMSVKAADLIKEMMKQGVMATINQAIDQETAVLLVEELGHRPHIVREDDLEEAVLSQTTEPEGAAEPRSAVVTIMGHVDHGKTTLLDYIRRAKVASGEAGGITQHIGAYRVPSERGDLTFLDTPGHEAFTAMRARGAQVTDVVILVVAADDGVMPQTEEAIKHARAAGVPLVVAVNKMDREEANPDRVKNELVAREVVPEEFGGDVQFIPCSALNGQGVEALLEAVALQAELLELKAVRDCPASGVVVESSLDRGRGPVATILVQNGVLNQGDTIISGTEFGRVRALLDERGDRVKSAGPSTPVVVLGLSGLPEAGDEVLAVEDERKARELVDRRREKSRDKRLQAQKAARMDELFSQSQDDVIKTVNLVVKGDVQGSVEALTQSLTNLATDEVRIVPVATGVGAINESDVNLAIASEALLIGFNVRADAKARRLAQENDVKPHYYSIIYDAIDQLRNAISGMLEPETREQIIGTAEVREVYRSSQLGQIAGCLVVDGVVRRRNPIRVLRNSVVVFEGDLESLRRFKDDVNEVQSGTECGIGVRHYNDVRVGDQIECYERLTIERTL
ncbi:translation initiation factor IF-2 [Spiribacter vilamensis]|uniref:Translation initiation factor IF-2 n=1 Tax=Spiribacter vilamensis TaxID=531306 RepID=A0A4Q8D0Q2_9GAMM|nr:translation initiation factor IF-2 [Spiribacter vilamensis]RZU98854.1 translation initiation factor 2 (bIF-2) [Spiribacter vilamensis]TVO62128.1 translation initiation factor IF-2 [Spiribacter vilamensis]